MLSALFDLRRDIKPEYRSCEQEEAINAACYLVGRIILGWGELASYLLSSIYNIRSLMVAMALKCDQLPLAGDLIKRKPADPLQERMSLWTKLHRLLADQLSPSWAGARQHIRQVQRLQTTVTDAVVVRHNLAHSTCSLDIDMSLQGDIILGLKCEVPLDKARKRAKRRTGVPQWWSEASGNLSSTWCCLATRA
jgi:hypothetical protein